MKDSVLLPKVISGMRLKGGTLSAVPGALWELILACSDDPMSSGGF